MPPSDPRIQPASTATVEQAAALIRAGGLVALPTETVYGLGANALDPRAVARIFEVKGRPSFDPLIVHAATAEAAFDLVESTPAQAQLLADRLWPGPLTLVLPRRSTVPDIVVSGLPGVAVRVPSHPVAQALLAAAMVPIAAPSANRFGAISPTTAMHVFQELGLTVDMILDGGPCQHGLESTVVSFMEDPPVLLRPGGMPAETIEDLIGPLARRPRAGSPAMSPGMLDRHYAPHTPLVLHRAGSTFDPVGRRVGLLMLRLPPDDAGYAKDYAKGFAAVEELSPAEDLRQAAANLFAAMRRLDAAGLELIYAHLVPDSGLGLAINDRLRRASTRP
ncbi:MAG: L-threonylcarbamoyladenylate synthase [Planctomycetota bacterium]|nr:L-threonylcarbamoyladenylate synthase [Planctomycetota bacterium]